MSLLLYQAELRALAAQSKRIIGSALAILRLRKKGDPNLNMVAITEHLALGLLRQYLNRPNPVKPTRSRCCIHPTLNDIVATTRKIAWSVMDDTAVYLSALCLV